MIELYSRRRNLHTDAIVFFFNDTATTEIYTLSLHDALPISPAARHPRDDRLVDHHVHGAVAQPGHRQGGVHGDPRDRKSTRLNSSHANISYAVFCLKKKNNDAYYFPLHSCDTSPTPFPIISH